MLLDENFVAMVSDFGLSRDVYESGAYENTSGVRHVLEMYIVMYCFLLNLGLYLSNDLV